MNFIHRNLKLTFVIFVIIGFLSISGAFWWGGAFNQFHTDIGENSSAIKDLSLHLRSCGRSCQLQDIYNLGILYYREGKYQEAVQQFQSVLNQNNEEILINVYAFYNIGNAYVQLMNSNKTQPLKKKLLLVQKSLENYRGAIKLARQNVNIEDKDLKHNYQLVRQYIKLLKEKIRKSEILEDQKKAPFQLLTEIYDLEKKIQELPDNTTTPSSFRKKQAHLKMLLELRQKSLNKIFILKKKLNTPKQTPPLNFSNKLQV